MVVLGLRGQQETGKPGGRSCDRWAELECQTLSLVGTRAYFGGHPAHGFSNAHFPLVLRVRLYLILCLLEDIVLKGPNGLRRAEQRSETAALQRGRLVRRRV